MKAQSLRRPPTPRSGLTREVMTFALPLILQNLSYTTLGVADTFFVAQLGTQSLAAVGLANVLFFGVLLLFRGVTNSSVILVARAHGAADAAGVGAAVWRVFYTALLFVPFVFGLPALFGFLLQLTAPDPTMQALGSSYLSVRSFEVPLVMFTTVVWGFLIGRGDSRTPMLLAWSTVLLNILLDWLLVLGPFGLPAFGVLGAAYATLFANVVTAAASAVILWRPVNRRDFGTGIGKAPPVQLPELGRVVALGLPMGMGDFIHIASFSAFFALLGRISNEALAATQIGLQYMNLAFSVGVGLGMATASLVSRALGAKRPREAERVSVRAVALAVVMMGLIGLSFVFSPQPLIEIFSRDPGVVAAGVTVLRIGALFLLVDASGIVLAGALNGAGDTRFTMLTRALIAWGLFLPLAWLLAFPLGGGLAGAWLAAFLHVMVIGVVYLVRFRSGRWQRFAV